MKPDYQRAVPDVIAALGTDAARGLTETEARTRLTTFGPNNLPAERPTPAWRKFVAQFRDLLVILLLVATAISALLWWYERDSPLPYEAIAIGLVVLLNAVMGYLQEQRAESASLCAAARRRACRPPTWCQATSSSSKKAIRFQPTRA